MSTTTTVYSNTADGYIQSVNATYATARSGGTLTSDNTNTVLAVGQDKATNYYCLQSYIYFDTGTPIPDTDTIETATLSLYGYYDGSTTDFVLEARLYTWSGSGLTTADWVAGASLSGKTLLATYATSGGWPTNAYTALVSEAAFVNNINKTGNTEILLDSDRQAAGTTPTGAEYVYPYSADQTGTTSDPKLVVVHAPPAAGFTSLINTSSVA